MAETQITISSRNGVLFPSQTSVRVVEGDSIAFSASDGGSATLFFSPDAVAVLSPSPSGPVKLAAGASRSFTFTSSNAGAYSVFLEPEGSSGPAAFPVGASNSLRVEVDIIDTVFTAQNNDMKTG